MDHLPAALLDARKILLLLGAQAEFPRNDLFGEIAVADEQRHDENSRCKDAAHYPADGRFKLPKAFRDLRKQFASAQLIRVLVGRRGGLRVEGGAVADENQRGVGKGIVRHDQWLADGSRMGKFATELPLVRKLCS
jgi:hypothetical protein